MKKNKSEENNQKIEKFLKKTKKDKSEKINEKNPTIIKIDEFPPMPENLKNKYNEFIAFFEYDIENSLFIKYNESNTLIINKLNLIFSKTSEALFFLFADDSLESVDYVNQILKVLSNIKYENEFTDYFREDIYSVYNRLNDYMNSHRRLSNFFAMLLTDEEKKGIFNKETIESKHKFAFIYKTLLKKIADIGHINSVSTNQQKYIDLKSHEEKFKKLFQLIKEQNKLKEESINNNSPILYLNESLLKIQPNETDENPEFDTYEIYKSMFFITLKKFFDDAEIDMQ